MYHRSLYDIVMETGRSIGVLTQEMQGEAELFASALTLRAVEAQLLIMAHTLGNVTPVLHQRLMQVDWIGWAALHDKLRNGVQPRRMFRFVDPKSLRTLALRSDMTVQVGRIAATALAQHARPLRLCYAGQVVTIKGDGLDPTRERLQLGAELIGNDSVAAAAEGNPSRQEIEAMLGKKGSYEYNLVGKRLLRPIDEALLKRLLEDPEGNLKEDYILSTWLLRIAAEGDTR